MSDAKNPGEKIAAEMVETFRSAGNSMWETPAGAAAIRLLAKQESVTVPDIIAELERDGAGDRRIAAMNESVIAKLRELEERRRQG